MKKTLLVSLLLAGSTLTFAQKKKVNETNDFITKTQEALQANKLSEAVSHIKSAQAAIDAAILDPSTSEKYDTWMKRAIVYSLLGQVDQANGPAHFKASSESLNKAYALDSKKTVKYDNVMNLVANVGANYYNMGVNSMNSTKYKNAQEEFTKAYEVLNFDEGKLFPKNSFTDTTKMMSNYYAGLCAYYAQDYNAAVTLLERAIGDPITTNESNAYVTLNNAYAKTGNKAKQLEVITKGKAKFKNDPNMATAEINYYIESGELETVTKKINDELANDPKRDDLYYNLGLINVELIKKGVKNEEEEVKLYDEALKNFKKAYELKPDFKYEYLMGLASFNAGAIYNNKINNVFEEKEQKKLEQQRDVYFVQATKYYTNIHNGFLSKDKSSLSSSDKGIWQQALVALKEIAMANNNEAEYKKFSELIQKL